MHLAIEQLVTSPRLPQYVAELERLLAEERQRRERFHAEVSEERKWEFINGQVIMHSPSKHKHLGIVRRLTALLSTWVHQQALGVVHFEKALVNLTRNDYEPDVCFFGRAKAEAFSPDQMRFPAPDFVCEVLSESTEKHDRVVKFEDYALHGVAEYWIVDPDAKTLEQYLLHGEAFELHRRLGMGDRVISTAVCGFEIPVGALFDDAASHQTLGALMGMP